MMTESPTRYKLLSTIKTNWGSIWAGAIVHPVPNPSTVPVPAGKIWVQAETGIGFCVALSDLEQVEPDKEDDDLEGRDFIGGSYRS